MNKLDKLSRYAPTVLRVGIALVVFWFGVNQLCDPGAWVRLLPNYVKVLGLAPQTLILINGWFEVLVSLLLLLGFYARIVSALVALHILHITTVVGYGAIGVRDFGLFMASLSIFLFSLKHE